MKKRACILILLIGILSAVVQPVSAKQVGIYPSYTGPYEEYIEKMLPFTFVYYEDISELGSTLLRFWATPALGSYSYVVQDENEFKLIINIYRANPFSNYSVLDQIESDELSPEMTDMRTIPTSNKSFYSYLREDMVFRYDDSGKLYMFHYYTKPTIFSPGIYITIKDNNPEWNTDLGDYPMDGEETLLSRILSLDEKVSSEAIRELKTLVEKSRQRQIIFEISLIAAALIVVVLVIVYFKKLRQKRLYKKYLKMHSETTE